MARAVFIVLALRLAQIVDATNQPLWTLPKDQFKIDEDETALLDFYKPCEFPCSNFTAAFLAEANAIWFMVDDIMPVGSDSIRLEITQRCRLDASGSFDSTHIISK